MRFCQDPRFKRIIIRRGQARGSNGGSRLLNTVPGPWPGIYISDLRRVNLWLLPSVSAVVNRLVDPDFATPDFQVESAFDICADPCLELDVGTSGFKIG